MNKGNNIEALSADMLNDDFVRIFQPIFIVLRVLGLLRINIKYRYPTAPPALYHLYSNAFWILNTVCVIYYLMYCEKGFDSSYADSTLKFGVIMNGINGILIVCRNNIYRGNKISQMYVKLQKIERYLNMTNTESLNKQLTRRVIVVILCVCVLTTLRIIFFNVVFMKNTCLALIVTLSTGVGLHMELTQVYFIIYLLTIRVNNINNVLQQSDPTSIKPFRKSVSDGKLFIIMNTSENADENPLGKVVSSMQCILEALSDLTELFQFSVRYNQSTLVSFKFLFYSCRTQITAMFYEQIFCFICQIFAWNLVSIKNLATTMKEQVSKSRISSHLST